MPEFKSKTWTKFLENNKVTFDTKEVNDTYSVQNINCQIQSDNVTIMTCFDELFENLSEETWEANCYYHRMLSFEQRRATIVLLSAFIHSDSDIPKIKFLALRLLALIKLECLLTPCIVAREAEESSYIEATVEYFGEYLPQEEFDLIHAQSHELVELLADLQDSEQVKNQSFKLNFN